jgi:hypothetical protein
MNAKLLWVIQFICLVEINPVIYWIFTPIHSFINQLAILFPKSALAMRPINVGLHSQVASLLGICTGLCKRVAGFASADIWSSLLISIRSYIFDQDCCSAIQARSNSLSTMAADLTSSRAKTGTTACIN